MANNAILWVPGSVTGTQIITNSTAGDDAGALSSEVDNATNEDRWMGLRCTIDPNGTPTGPVDVYIVYALDGSTYDSGDASTEPPASAKIGSIDVTQATSVQYTVGPLMIMPFKFKIVMWNRTGVSMTDLDVYLETFNEEVE